MATLIGRKTWKMGDRVRVLNARTKSPAHRPPADVTTTYGHVFLHDIYFGETIVAKPSTYITGFREKPYLLDEGYFWDPTEIRLRAVQKPEAEHSISISGIDDFWLMDLADPSCFILDNMRSNKSRIRFLVMRECLPVLQEKLGVFLDPGFDNTEIT